MKTLLTILALTMLLSCQKPDDCECAKITDSGWDNPGFNYTGYWQELTFCSGATVIHLVPTEADLILESDCIKELPEIDIDNWECE